MRLTFAAAVILLSLLGSAAADTPFLVGGIQVNEPDHDRWVQALQQAGMNTVAVTVYAQQGDWDSDHLWWNDEEPAVLEEIREAKAEGLRVVLILRLAVDHAFARNKFVWHGMVMPSSPEKLASWFAQYTRFVTKWAAIAEREGVDVFGVGSEMNALTATLPVSRWGNLRNFHGVRWYEKLYRRRAQRFADRLGPSNFWVRGYPNYETLDDFLDARLEHKMVWARQAYLRPGGHTLKRINARREHVLDLWRKLIAEVRGSYRGKLTYAANFDAYHNVAFWKELDVLGVNSYFPLRTDIERELDDAAKSALFENRWREILGRLDRFKEDQRLADMPVIFTEIGYTFRRHSTVEPWNHGGFSVVGWKGKERKLVVWEDQPVDYEERRLALDALRSVHRETGSDLTGILYWKLSTIKAHERIEPFVLHVGPDSEDPLQQALARFAD